MLTNLAAAFAERFGGLPSYYDGVLRRFAYTDNGKGTMSKAPIEAPCRAQIDALTQAQRAGEYAEDDVRLIILTDGLSQYLPDGRVQDDDELEIPSRNETYRIAGPSRDPLDTHWVCRGRVKPQ